MTQRLIFPRSNNADSKSHGLRLSRLMPAQGHETCMQALGTWGITWLGGFAGDALVLVGVVLHHAHRAVPLAALGRSAAERSASPVSAGSSGLSVCK